MASYVKRFKENVEGDFFVDSSCINCDTCRQLAPGVFQDLNGYSVVLHQPKSPDEIRQTHHAIISCPTGSIGTLGENQRKMIRKDFPLLIDENVYYNGYNSPKSFGGNSYFIKHPEGNWLIDSPRFSTYLAKKIERLGGVRYIFLTHRDDVADAEKYTNFFPGCERIIHEHEKSAQPDAEVIINGYNSKQMGEVTIIPTPGHTKGHMVLLFKDKYLFTGDHLYWRRDWQRLRASRRYCWYNWDAQKNSLKKLQTFSFTWILPGHGQRIHLSSTEMSEKLQDLVDQIEDPNYW
ncbi:MAG: MBL fold metallo-hydrolase [Candidatus Kariarchaeaceae archaeon]|jgi:glyoxylase-like metal-dependent hydrolase (beta-lactamase superfamily II)/ferredoxin